MGTLALVFVLIAQKTTTDKVSDEEAKTQTVVFDEETALGDDAQYGAIVAADELVAALNGGLDGRKRQAVDSLADSTLNEEARGVEENDAYEQALVKTGAATIEDVLSEKESVEWFLHELDEIHSHSDETFEEERLRLANAEAGIAKLRDEAEVARQKYEALVQENNESKDAGELKRRIAELDREIEKLQEEAVELRNKNAAAKKSYAIVPYQGKKGTFRRPIYVECKDSGVYIEPEGVRFDERDFLLAHYPGNPFDSALRAASQRYLVTGGQKTVEGKTIEPYPLIVVRPSGARYFYAAIAALASWGELYGYEFVEEDQTLEYPSPDPVLARLAQDQANLARARMQVQLAAALSIRNAQIAADGRAQRNARGAATVADAHAPASELQSRFGANVRLGAANPYAGSGPGNRAIAANRTPHAERRTPAGAPGMVAGPPIGGGTLPGRIGPGSRVGVDMNAFGHGGVFTGAASNVANASGSGAAVMGDRPVPAVPYTGRFGQNMVAGPDGANGNSGEHPHTDELVNGGTNASGAGVAPGVSGATDASGTPNASVGEQLAQNGAGVAPGVPNASANGDEAASNAMNANGYLASGNDARQTTTQYVANAAAQPQEPSAPDGNNAPQNMTNFIETPKSPQRSDPAFSPELSNTPGVATFDAGATDGIAEGEFDASANASTNASAGSSTSPGGAQSSADSGEANGLPNFFNKSVELNAPPETKKEIREDEKTPKEAFLVSRELTRTATRGNERGIVVRCTDRGYVFPKQPGLRSSYSVSSVDGKKTRQERDAELADVVTLCVKSWGVAGRNMYWAPYMKAEVSSGGESSFKELQEFCDSQGITLVRSSSEDPRSSKR